MNKLPYEFYDDRREIRFDRFDLPAPWINYLSNGRMHAFVSQAGGGMSWWLSPMMFRLTRYRFYNMPIDSPGFYVYLRMADGTVWSPTFRPCETPVDFREASHTPGYSTFTAKKNGLTATLKLFMAQDHDTLVWDLKLTNDSGAEISCDVFAYVELSQFLAREENILGYYLKWNTRAVFNEELQAITYAYTAWMHPRKDESPLVTFGSDAKIDSFCCNRDVFCGNYRDERNPVEVRNGRLSNTNLQGGEPCGALHTHVSLGKGEEKQLHFFLGVTKKANLVLTDQPYNVNYEGTAGKIKNDHMANDAFYQFLLDAFTNMEAVMADDASIYVFHADTEGLSFRRAFADAGFYLSGCCIWKKNSLVLGRSPYQWIHEPVLFGWKKSGKHAWYAGRKETTVWEYDKPKKNADHPTMKPIALLAYPIMNSSMTNALVLDPFGGSGSTLIACEQSERTCYTVELDEKYCDVIVKRYIEQVGSAEGVTVLRDGVTLRFDEVSTVDKQGLIS